MNKFEDQEKDQFISYTFHENKKKGITNKDTIVFLSKKLSVGQNFIQQRLNALGLTRKKGCIVRPFHEDVKKWLKEGHSLDQISNKLGISRSTLYVYCSDNQIKVPSKWYRQTPKQDLESVEIIKDHDNFKSVKRRMRNKNLIDRMLKVKW